MRERRKMSKAIYKKEKKLKERLPLKFEEMRKSELLLPPEKQKLLKLRPKKLIARCLKEIRRGS